MNRIRLSLLGLTALTTAACGAPAELEDTATATSQGIQINRSTMYAIRSVSSGKCVDVSRSSLKDAARIQLWSCNDSHAQHFYFRDRGDGNYTIHNVNSDKCLDVGGGQSGDANVFQYRCTGAANQSWHLDDVGNGNATLTAQHSGQALDGAGGSSADGAGIIQSPLHGATNQQFVLEPVQPQTVNPATVPIKHVVIIVKENHTFDNYFGSYPGGVDGTLTDDSQNLCDLPQGHVACPHAPDAPKHDMCHGHDCGLIDWNGGKMDGWSKPGGSDTGDNQTYAQYGESDIPNYWAYARQFVLADHFYSNMIGPSFPGHFFTVAAQAGWATDNPPTDLPFKVSGFPPKFYGPHPYWGCDEWPSDTVSILANGTTPKKVFPCFNIPTLPNVLPSGVSWKFYGTNFDGLFSETWSMLGGSSRIRNNATEWAKVVNESQFAKDIQNHSLPSVTWLVNQDQNSEHPDLALPGLNIPLGGVCAGEGWTVKYINQIMQSAYWKSTAILVTFDDYGGWRDHVAPPRQYGGTPTAPYGLGFRLPLMIISPYAKPGFVFHEVAEQASLARFVERIFGSTTTLHDLDAAAQDSQANDLLGAFDFNQTPLEPVIRLPRSCPPAL